MLYLARVILFAILFSFGSSLALAAVNINTATQSQLEELPGIGPTKALAIIQYRTDHGPFTVIAQLDNVPGIGPATMAALADLISVEDELEIDEPVTRR